MSGECECECKQRVGPLFHCFKCIAQCEECNPPRPTPLTDEALANLLAKAEEDSKCSGLAEFQRAFDPSGGTVTSSVIASLVSEVQASRSAIAALLESGRVGDGFPRAAPGWHTEHCSTVRLEYGAKECLETCRRASAALRKAGAL